MGLSQSLEASEGGTYGYHVHGVQPNSPAEKAGLQPFFDFILSLDNKRLNEENDLLKELLKANMEKAVRMEVYSTKTTRVRELDVVPSNMWGGQGLLGASVRFCSYQGANENVWHVLDVEASSPAALAGLQPYSDYIVGADQVLQDSEDFFSLIEAHEGKPLKLLVYDTQTDTCREVMVTPNGAWGGEGSLGCGIGYGYLHRIPVNPDVSTVKPSSLVPEEKPSPQQPSHGYTEAPLMTSSSQSEDLLDVEQITLQQASLLPPIQRVTDPDSEVTATNPDPLDLMDKLDLSTSSIDMTNTSLAMQEEKEAEISGVELEDSVLLSLSAENQSESQELVSQSAEDLPAAHTAPDAVSDSGGPSAESSHLVAESTDQRSVLSEPSSSPGLPEEPAEEPPSPSPVDLVPASTLNESTTDSRPPQTSEDAQRSVCESAGSAHQCDHEHGEEEPEETRSE
ncbi:Golgi reassembly-stacking protein 1a isoform X2 [Kryptolebias marmoratus]|uniref:Golgi reassembly-stacking protein 1a isoform X2 n=1 Tax=Kryptolebias marmoratus TaxID=37003 RepID=UPI0007F898C1|nr:Golgi reassembly-stacking protein 1a isoform X2 [Kryptolebias marmoratus]